MLITEIKIRDKMEIPADKKIHPEEGHFGKVVWISDNGKTVVLRCERQHNGKTTAFKLKINSKKSESLRRDERMKCCEICGIEIGDEEYEHYDGKCWECNCDQKVEESFDFIGA